MNKNFVFRQHHAILASLVCFALFSGCAGPKATRLDKEPNCASSVEGFFHSKEQWDKKVPALIVKGGGDPVILYGTIQELREDGIVFDPNRESPFYDPEAIFYPSSDIVAAIGQNRQVIFGRLPQRYGDTWVIELHLQHTDTPTSKPLRMILNPNERFGFCLPAGEYQVKEIFFSDHKKNVDRGVEYPDLRLTATPNTSTYIGDIYLDYAPPSDSTAIVIPYKITARPDDSGLALVLGGFIGVTIYEVSLALKGVAGVHVLQIRDDLGFTTTGTYPQKRQLLKQTNSASVTE